MIPSPPEALVDSLKSEPKNRFGHHADYFVSRNFGVPQKNYSIVVLGLPDGWAVTRNIFLRQSI